MSPNKISKRFFHSNSRTQCPICKEQGITSLIGRSIDILGQSAFGCDEDYCMFIRWERSKETSLFQLIDYGNKTPEEYQILDSNHTIDCISSLVGTCIEINKFGFKIDEVRLISNCDNDNCRFRHIIDFDWIKEMSSLILDYEYVKLSKYKIGKNYQHNSTTISTISNPIQTYDFNFIMNINLRDYSKIENKINHALLLG